MKLLPMSRRLFTLRIAGSTAAILLRPYLSAQSPTSRLVVKVSGLRNGNGKVQVRLWNAKEGFLKDESKAIRRGTVDIASGAASATFTDLPQGEYAVSAYHDENSNGKMDTRFPGIPVEGVGVSNDPHKRFGPPPYEACRFALREPEQTVSIVIEY